MELFILLITTGIPGMFSYWYLSQLGIVNHNTDSKDDKVLVIAALSLFNMLISVFVYEMIASCLFKRPFLVDGYTRLDIFLLFITAVLTTFLLSRCVYPSALKKVQKSILRYQNNENIPIPSNGTGLEELMRDRPKEFTTTFIYIFDFDNKFIESGGLYAINSKRHEIILHGDSGYTRDPYYFQEVLSDYNKREDHKSRKIFIDYERKIKIFAFHFID
ncbi:hypothetical protein [Listeria booriae]|uniref:hypothetical protein n=1 Tax=Listeria booriae TaxID=1552123 RepID=UPI00162AA7E1|nr:hypothetical protein [Listeria booriae]MBC1800792.1 hypothetical protein [Listeria booriae]MBC1803766.1 hypothetical protein [Listeria booriae]